MNHGSATGSGAQLLCCGLLPVCVCVCVCGLWPVARGLWPVGGCVVWMDVWCLSRLCWSARPAVARTPPMDACLHASMPPCLHASMHPCILQHSQP